MTEKEIKKYLHHTDEMQPIEDDLNKSVAESDTWSPGCEAMFICLHDQTIVNIKESDNKLIIRMVQHSPYELIDSDLVDESWCDSEYPYLLFDIIIEGVEWVYKEHDFNQCDFRLAEAKHEMYNESKVLFYCIIDCVDNPDDRDGTEFGLNFKSYKYKLYGRLNEKLLDELRDTCREEPNKQHPLFNID